MNQKTSKDKPKEYAIAKFRKAMFEIPTGKAVRKANYKYISYGDDNKFPIYLDNLRQQPQHSRILNSKIDWIAKEGFDLELLTPEQRNWFVENDLNDLVYKISRDYETYGGFSFFVIMSRDGQSVARIEYQDFSKVRINAEVDDESFENKYLIGDDWTKYRTDVEEVDGYDKENPKQRSLVYYVGNSKDMYPEPSYYGGIQDIQISLEIKNFHLSHVKNGFFIPTIIQYNNGIPDEERQDELVREVESAFTGTDNAGRILVAFNNDKEQAITIDSFEPTELDKMFDTLGKDIKDNIYESHGINGIIFGKTTEGALGQRNEMLDAFKQFYSEYVKPRKYEICSILKSVFSPNWTDMELELRTIPPIEEEVDKEVLTIYEKRKLQGVDDSELTDTERTLLMIKDMSPEMRVKFLDTLTREELHLIIGYSPIETEITEEDNNE